MTAVAGGAAGTQFAVVPRWALGTGAPAPTVLAMTGPRLDQAALLRAARRAVPGAQVTLRSRLLAAIAGAPLPHGGFVSFAQGAAAAGGFSLLVVLLTQVLGARSRELTLARLGTMGLAAAQSRRIMAVETLPAILAAAVGGIACALLMVPLVGPAVNLAAFTGTPVTVPLRADPAAIAVAAAALLVLARADAHGLRPGWPGAVAPPRPCGPVKRRVADHDGGEADDSSSSRAGPPPGAARHEAVTGQRACRGRARGRARPAGSRGGARPYR